MHSSFHGIFLTITLLLAIVILSAQVFVEAQFNDRFIRDCNDPLITKHNLNSAADLHTFCYHSCGYDIFNVTSVTLDFCTPSGICQCNHPCGTPPPTKQFGDQCPPHRQDPADPDPFYAARCNATCADLCPGGRGLVCGEVYMTPIPPTINTWAKICTCYCPPQVCVLPTTTTTTTSATTTSTTTSTTQAPPTTSTATPTTKATPSRTRIVIVPIKMPVLPFLVLFKVIKIAKMVNIVYVLLKFCTLYWYSLAMTMLAEREDVVGWQGWKSGYEMSSWGWL